ncbi:VIR protein [Plasmodium vivax]|uniref:VIR protein n=1 Tax=Plasmodium vivax TaxID=5855 RepID=A0A1G4GRN6_PLAVI|nr:VIR protein [Plasmodium vivax]
MASVTVSSYKESSELSKDDCVTLYLDIKGELEEKFLVFQYTEDTDIRKKCDDLNNYIKTRRELYKKCEKYYVSDYYINIDKGIKDLSTEYNKYTKCSSESTSNGKEDDKSNPETKDLRKDQAECAKEQVLQVDKKSESGCKKESSQSGCLQQEKLLEQNGNHSPVSDQTTAEQQTAVALKASTLDDLLEPNCPLYNSADIGVFASPSCPSQDKLNPSSDAEENNLSHDIHNNKQYAIPLVHDERSYKSINGYGPSNGDISDVIIINLLKNPSPKRKYSKRIYEPVNRRTSEGVVTPKNFQLNHHPEVSMDTKNSQHHHNSVQHVSPAPQIHLIRKDSDDEGKADVIFPDFSGHSSDHEHLSSQEQEAHRQDSRDHGRFSNENIHRSNIIPIETNTHSYFETATLHNVNTLNKTAGSTEGLISTEGVRLQLNDATPGAISLTEYIKFIITFLGTIILFLFLLKFTPLKFIFNKRKKKRRRKRKERLERILSGPTHAENDIYMLYSPFQYYQWEEPP